MHGLLVWSCVTVLALLASLCLVRDVGGNVAVLLAQNAERDTALAQNELVPGWKRLRETGTGSYSPDDRPRPALFVVGEVERGVPAPAGRGLDLPAYVALMICAALAISLFGGIAGGLLGTRSPGYLRSLDEADWRVEEERLVASRPR
jgi:hypothetical protein